MTAAAADAVSKERCELIRVDFLRTASYGELDLICADKESDAYVNAFRLKREIADDTQDGRIAGFSLDYKIFVALVIFIVKDRFARDLQLVQ